MTKSTDVAKTEPGGEVAELSPQEAALLAAQDAEYQGIQLQVPLLKIGQPLTNEVQEGEASAGDFINALTGDVLGSDIEFIVSKWNRGRFRSTEDRTYVTSDLLVPESWTDEADVPFIGKPFAEHPDAEEQFKVAVNAKEREWGKGPPIQTTINFTGYVVGHDVPVRLSLKSTHLKPARRWITLIRILRAPWDAVFDLSTFQDSNTSNQKYYVPTVKRGRPTSADERAAAVELAQQIQDADHVQELGADDASDPEAAKRAADKAEAASDGLAV